MYILLSQIPCSYIQLLRKCSRLSKGVGAKTSRFFEKGRKIQGRSRSRKRSRWIRSWRKEKPHKNHEEIMPDQKSVQQVKADKNSELAAENLQ